jgi:hypothetical protein
MARNASELTLAIRDLLSKSKGSITASGAVAPLRELGFENVNAVAFNQVKAQWAARQKIDKGEKAPKNAEGKRTKRAKGKERPAVSQDEALAFVRENGGLKLAKQVVQRQIDLIREAEQALLALA